MLTITLKKVQYFKYVLHNVFLLKSRLMPVHPKTDTVNESANSA